MNGTAKRTRFEIIAEALPLHAQRIAEVTFNESNDRLEYLMTTPIEAHETASSVLIQSFVFTRTTEGHEYWWALASGVRL